MFRYILSVALIACLAGCKEEKKDPLRLDHSVEPLSQLISLSLDPGKDVYSGEVTTEIQVHSATKTFRLHARGPGILAMRITGNGKNEEVSFMEGEKGTLTVTAARELEPAVYSLHTTFTNTYSLQGTGIYKVTYEGRNYLFSQFEPEYARESFPCWDAPEFKIPWEMQLIVPSNYTAVANTPVKSERLIGEQKEVVFEQTKPMPSYLVALAVGEFDRIPVPGLPDPGHIIVPNGKSGLAAEAVRIAPPLLRALEDYFEIPYPYAKLDMVAVPEFNYGAMENVGLITYRDTILLRDPKAVSLSQKQRIASVIAHEMSHMWFGDLVTPKWWDDLWLNESFASWMALKVVNQVFPEYEMANNDIQSRQYAMETDALSTSRPIRRTIAASDAMQHLFDRLAYNKGMAVLDMVEDWMGEEPFRKGMIQYMNDRAWGNADAFDLAESLSSVVDGDVLAIMKSFVNQAGIPFLEIAPLGGNTIRITQKRYAQYGVQPQGNSLWTVPVAIEYSDGENTHIQKVLLSKASQTFKLDHPAVWLYPNADEKGYYRWALSPEQMAVLADEIPRLGIRNRIGFISNLEALFSAGEIPADSYLGILASFADDPSPEVRQSVVGKLSGFPSGMVPQELDNDYGAFLATVFRPMLETIGIEKVDGEPVLNEQLRCDLIGGLGWRCKAPEILELAKEKARAYMEDPYSVDPSLAQPFLRLAAMNGDAELFNAYVGKYESSAIPVEKANFLSGLSGFRDPVLMKKALNYAISDSVLPHQFGSIPYHLTDTDQDRQMVLDWLESNYPAIRKKIPEQSLSYLPWLFCGHSPDLLAHARTFLLADGRKTQGMAIEFGKADAVVTLNAGLRKKELENIKRFLKEQNTP